MNTESIRTLPSADWLAFGTGIAALVLSYIYPPLLLLVGIAVFLPSVLRELRILNDCDEWTRQIMHRAGFHSLLVVVLLTLMRAWMPVLGVHETQLGFGPETAFGGETLRKACIWVFLISYLLQYWGPSRGAFRILLAVGILNVAPILGFLRMQGDAGSTGIIVSLIAAVFFAALGFLVRARPRTGGYVLLALLVVALLFMGNQMADPRIAWGGVAVVIQAVLVLGVTGIALVRDPN